MKNLLQIATKAAAAATAILKANFLQDAQIVSQENKDIKTLADVVAQNKILEILAETNIPVIAEESTNTENHLKELCWLIDPLDGTLNFTRNFPMAAVSIALWQNNQPLLGVIQDIHYNTLYTGIVGEGAWLNEQPMMVSKVADMRQAIIATGFPSGRSYETSSLLTFVQKVQQFKKVRMLGSAALMLAQVAAGRFDAYEEEDIYLWDVAAGLALVKAAGGNIHFERGSAPFKYKVVASNGNLNN